MPKFCILYLETPCCLREAAKTIIFLMTVQLREGGGVKGLAIKRRRKRNILLPFENKKNTLLYNRTCHITVLFLLLPLADLSANKTLV